MVWNPHDTPIDYVKLGGLRSPGIATVTGGVSPFRLVERSGYGLSGAFVVFRGIGLAKPTVTLRLFEPAHWEEWAVFRRLVQRPPVGERAKALDIWHPLLEQIDVKSVLVESVSQPEETDDGEWTVTIKFVENRRPQVQLSKPEGSKAKPIDPVDQRIEELTAQVQELSEG